MKKIDRCVHDVPWSWCRLCTPLLEGDILDAQDLDSDLVWIVSQQDGCCLNCGEYIEKGVTTIAWSSVRLGFVCCVTFDPPDLNAVERARKLAMEKHPSQRALN